MAVKQLSDGGPDGTTLGQSTSDLIAFHGVSPSARGILATLTSGSLGDANTKINAILDALIAKGLLRAS